MNTSKVRAAAEKLVYQANFALSKDVLSLLHKAMASETNPMAKKALAWIVENAAVASMEKTAICQDTGLPVIFIKAGGTAKISREFIEAVEDGVAAGYEKNYLRPSIVDPLERGKSFYKGASVHVEFCSGLQGVRIFLMPKGFGSENKSKLKMFYPTASFEDIEKFIVDSVAQAGPESCPPFVIGVGIGSTADGALVLAKEALFEDLSKTNPNRLLAEMEARLLGKINALGIGPMGYGGKTTALAVKILKSPTHIAGLPVGVNISCHALRKASVDFV